MKEILKSDRCEDIEDSCVLVEKQKDVNMEVKIIKLPRVGLKITILAGDQLEITKTGNPKCDYLILMPRENPLEIELYFVELKKTLRPLKKACKQILFTIALWDYLISTIKIRFYKEVKNIEKFKIEPHFVVISQKKSPSIDKQRIGPDCFEGESKYKDKDFKTISSSKDIKFEQLKCLTP